MKVHPITKGELRLAQFVLIIAIILQIALYYTGSDLSFGPHYLIITTEIILAALLSFTSTNRHEKPSNLHRNASILLLGLISVANISSFFLVGRTLILGTVSITGYELLVSAVAIFLTNIIVFALWYWELDSPGLTGRKWSRNDMDFQFPQQEPGARFTDWQPRFYDYLYISSTNAVNFASADAKPLSGQAKGLMGLQAMISAFTLALMIARSVNILG